MRWSARADSQAWDAAIEAIALVGGSSWPTGPALGSTNHVWLLDDPPLVVNVAAAGRSATELSDRLVAARFLAGLGIFPRLADGIEQPVPTRAGRLVTVWERMDVAPGPPDWSQVGAMVRYLADVGMAGLGEAGARLRAVDDLTDIAEAISILSASGRLPAADAAPLDRVCVRLHGELTSYPNTGHRIVVHGDLTPSNVLVTPKGAMLCDSDELGIGPADWDLTALLDWRRSSSSGRAREQLLAGWNHPVAGPSPASWWPADRWPAGSPTGDRSPVGSPTPEWSQAPPPAQVPTAERIRCLTRIAHLRRTLRLLGRQNSSPRDRYWDAVRLEGWRRVDREWSYQAFPELYLSRPRQLQHLLGRASGTARHRSESRP